jgi:threonine aldolase
MINKRGFASDNNAGAHPDILRAIDEANDGHVTGYGSDIYTEKARQLLCEQLGGSAEVWFVFTGTAANVLGLSGVTRSWHSVIVASTAHIEEDECGAPEKFIGCKVLTCETNDAKITVDMIARHIHGIDFEHHSQPKVVSITQATEMGTVYTVQEIRAISEYAHSHGMLLHMDGARIANAAVSLGLPVKEITTRAGVDILSFGGTKNGMMYGEAVCFLKPGLASDFKYIRKQSMQLASKMRFISAQYIAYLSNDLWKRCASHANEMAQLLANRLRLVDGISISQEVQANGVFAIIPSDVAERVRKQTFFYPWDDDISEYRLMCSWDTTEEDIDDLISLFRKELVAP